MKVILRDIELESDTYDLVRLPEQIYMMLGGDTIMLIHDKAEYNLSYDYTTGIAVTAEQMDKFWDIISDMADNGIISYKELRSIVDKENLFNGDGLEPFVL